MDVPKLYVSPEAREFVDKAELDEWLRGVDDNTLVRPPASADEVILNKDGRTADGNHRYTVNSFDTVCRALAPGLSSLVPNLAGENQRARRKKEFCSFEDALLVFNTLVATRFDAELIQCQFVFNEREKIIEGVLGPKTKYLDNSLFFQLVDETLVSAFGTDVEFYEAHLAGRRMLLRYCRKEPLCEVRPADGHSFHAIHRGYHFSNSESGDASVRAAPLYVEPVSGASCLGSFSKSKTRMIHAGREFHSRLNSLLSAAVMTGGADSAVSRAVQVAATRELQLPLPAHERFEEHVLELVENISGYGTITNNLAQKIVSHAVYVGAFPTEDNQYRALRDSQITRRTKYDLYRAITTEAIKLPIRQRESVEQAAYAYLLDLDSNL
jgi:hypothetical protein